MKILVTGGAGFIGTNLLLFLRKNHPNSTLVSYDIAQPVFPVKGVRYLHGDVRSYLHLREVTREVDWIFHLAAELGTHETFANPDIANETNIGGTVNLLESARTNQFALLVVSKPNIWLNPYSISKEAAEQYARMYFHEMNVPVIVMKWFSVYGPYQYVNKYQKAVPSFINSALRGEPLTIYGSGNQKADFVYVKDAVAAAVQAMEREVFGQTIEFGTGKAVSVNSLAQTVVRLTNSSSKIVHIPMRRGEFESSVVTANLRKAKELLNFEATVPLEQGLVKTIRFYKQSRSHYQVPD